MKSNPACLKAGGAETIPEPVVEEKPAVCNDDDMLDAITIVCQCMKVKETKKSTTGQKKALELLQRGDPDMLLKLVKKSNEGIYAGGVSYLNFHLWITTNFKD